MFFPREKIFHTGTIGKAGFRAKQKEIYLQKKTSKY